MRKLKAQSSKQKAFLNLASALGFKPLSLSSLQRSVL